MTEFGPMDAYFAIRDARPDMDGWMDCPPVEAILAQSYPHVRLIYLFDRAS